jgi:hypothetical protein
VVNLIFAKVQFISKLSKIGVFFGWGSNTFSSVFDKILNRKGSINFSISLNKLNNYLHIYTNTKSHPMKDGLNSTALM